MGSPAYAAPEQITGQATSARTDQYSLGIILYELLTGSHPFPNLADLTITELMQMRMSEPLPPLAAAALIYRQKSGRSSSDAARCVPVNVIPTSTR